MKKNLSQIFTTLTACQLLIACAKESKSDSPKDAIRDKIIAESISEMVRRYRARETAEK